MGRLAASCAFVFFCKAEWWLCFIASYGRFELMSIVLSSVAECSVSTTITTVHP